MTDEPADLVNEWLARAKPKYPIATLRGGLESFLQVQGYPTCAVIDPDGVVQYAGFTGMEESVLGDSMAKTKKAPLWPKSLAKITKLMVGDPAKAYAELKKAGELDPNSEDGKMVQSFVAYLEGRAGDALTEAKGFQEKGYIGKAVQAIQAYAGAEPPFPSSADSAQLLKDLQALPEFKKELAGGEAYEAAQAQEKSQEYLDAFDAYKSLAKKFAGTKIAENARTQAERIRSDGMPGYSSNCDDCHQAKRACDKHKKDVKL